MQVVSDRDGHATKRKSRKNIFVAQQGTVRTSCHVAVGNDVNRQMAECSLMFCCSLSKRSTAKVCVPTNSNLICFAMSHKQVERDPGRRKRIRWAPNQRQVDLPGVHLDLLKHFIRVGCGGILCTCKKNSCGSWGFRTGSDANFCETSVCSFSGCCVLQQKNRKHRSKGSIQ